MALAVGGLRYGEYRRPGVEDPYPLLFPFIGVREIPNDAVVGDGLEGSDLYGRLSPSPCPYSPNDLEGEF